MQKFFIRILCCLVPSQRMRHKIRHKVLAVNKKNLLEQSDGHNDCDQNHIWLVAPDGTRKAVRSVPGCTFNFSGLNNNVYLYEPINNMRLVVSVCNNTNITIMSGGQMNIVIHRSAWGCYGTANVLIESGFVSTGLVNIELCNGNPINVTIGHDCLFAQNISIRTGDYHTIVDKHTGRVLNYDKDVKIGDHVWVATGVYIGKGAVISDNSVVGAHSVVTRRFDESNVVIAGVPAQIVKRNIDWDIRSISDYLGSQK